jgi:hypothetical protein
LQLIIVDINIARDRDGWHRNTFQVSSRSKKQHNDKNGGYCSSFGSLASYFCARGGEISVQAATIDSNHPINWINCLR